MATTHERLFLLVAVGCLVLQSVGAMDHIVGGSFGWSIPKNATFYDNWARSKSFAVNDRLVFLFTTGVHNVLEVTKNEYDACTQESAIGVHYTGPTTLTLSTPGTHYFYCGVGRHCEAGQKLAISVTTSPGSIQAPGPHVASNDPLATVPGTSDGTGTTDNKSSASLVSFSGSLAGLLSLLLSLFI